MGDISELIINGTLCMECGCLIGDMIPKDGSIELIKPPGHPRKCKDCKTKKGGLKNEKI